MKRLIVLTTGTNGSRHKWSPILERLHREDLLRNSDWLIFNHCGFWDFQAFKKFLTKSIEELALELKAKIEEKYLAALNSDEPYDDIICIGHSSGGLIIRQAYLIATGAYPGTVESNIHWTNKVSRFVLIASINRGFKPNKFLVSEVVNLSSATGFLPFLRDCVQGSAFITNLRISWIRYISELEGQEPAMIQLLGTEDGIVKREDSIDLQQFPNGVQFDIPGANHDNLYRPQGQYPKALEEWELRYKLIRWAILECDPKQPDQMPSDLQEQITVNPGERVTESRTVFIVHGIRDSNSGWASQLEDQIRRHTNGKFAVIRSTYGYFSAFNFFFPWLRRQNIRWFQDQYSYRFALNPKTEFYFIGHSNGTYVLGESLKRVSAMKFKRIYLAGSVLPREYPWQERFDLDQVKELRNDRSCWDFPVGILCSGLRGLGMKDIGTGGFDGFNFDDDRIEEVYYYKGGHGKPLAKENQGSILAFTLDGNLSHPSNLLEITQISSKFQWISRMAPYFTPLLLLLVLCIGYLLAWCIFQDFAWGKLIISILILYSVYAFAKTV